MTQPDHPQDPGPVLASAARAVARATDLDATLEALLAAALADRGATAAVVATAGDDGLVRALRLAGAATLPADEVAGAPLGSGPTMDPLAAAILERRPVAAATIDEAAPGPFAAHNGLERVLAVPLVVSEAGIPRVLGVLALGWRAGEPGREGAPGVLDALVDLVAVAVDRAAAAAGAVEQGDWQERLAHLDPLTGLANRRTLDRVLELEIARADRQQGEVSVAVFDVDGFRARNEQAGVAAGDAILRAVAAVLADQVRVVDTVARIGGDEFVVVAPGSGGVVVADRILRAVDALGPVGGHPVSVSAGVARFPADGSTADELLGSALGALDGARAAGHGAIGEVRSG
ncbi:MAG TPA: GGDEF domain-containing protein [Patescibacteria group bacterium]|nr:GGDEF domain-containing protein [Patescibacteria group bacterium]